MTILPKTTVRKNFDKSKASLFNVSRARAAVKRTRAREKPAADIGAKVFEKNLLFVVLTY